MERDGEVQARRVLNSASFGIRIHARFGHAPRCRAGQGTSQEKGHGGAHGPARAVCTH
jgi:hypothetical protein